MRRLVLACTVVLAAASTAVSATLRVPSEYPTIQAGIDVAASGDTVLVAPGHYTDYENRVGPYGVLNSACAHLKGGVALLSEGGPDVTTIELTAADHWRVVVRGSYLGDEVRVEGFTITTSLSGTVGAAFTHCAMVTLEDCILRDIGWMLDREYGFLAVGSHADLLACRFVNIGAQGIRLQSSSVLVDGCWLENCSRHYNAALYGWSSSSAVVRNTTFLNNPTGAIRISSGDAELSSCHFEGNAGWGAGGAYLYDGDFVVRHNVFYDNHTTEGWGGGLVLYGPNWEVNGNTFHRCTVQQGSYGGAAAWLGGGGLGGEFENNVISECSGAMAVVHDPATRVMRDCNVYWSNPDGDTDFGYGPNDRVVDPWFCDPDAGDLTLNEVSLAFPRTPAAAG